MSHGRTVTSLACLKYAGSIPNSAVLFILTRDHNSDIGPAYPDRDRRAVPLRLQSQHGHSHGPGELTGPGNLSRSSPSWPKFSDFHTVLLEIESSNQYILVELFHVHYHCTSLRIRSISVLR
jgi:hypothetical protein